MSGGITNISQCSAVTRERGAIEYVQSGVDYAGPAAGDRNGPVLCTRAFSFPLLGTHSYSDRAEAPVWEFLTILPSFRRKTPSAHFPSDGV